MTAARRAVVATLFAVLTLGMVEVVRRRVSEVDTIVQNLLGPAVDRIPFDPAFTTALMVLGIAGASAAVAMLSGPRSAGKFAVVVVGALILLTFPFTHLVIVLDDPDDWSTVRIQVAPAETARTPTPAAWVLGGAMVLLGCFEALASSRETLLDDLRRRAAPRRDVKAVEAGTMRAAAAVATPAVLLAFPAAVAVAGIVGDVGLDVRAHLIIVPAIAGLALGAYLWLATRSRPS